MNPQAFPQNTVYQTTNGQTVQQGPVGGMTLRDYFAAKAMQALIGATSGTTYGKGREANITCANVAYSLADTMLAERSKP